jgi:hypothetical protein
MYSDNYGTPVIRVSGALGHIGTAVKNGTSMSVAAGANNGSSPPAPTLLSASSDTQGQLLIESGNTHSAGAQAVVTFANAFAAAAAHRRDITACQRRTARALCERVSTGHHRPLTSSTRTATVHVPRHYVVSALNLLCKELKE